MKARIRRWLIELIREAVRAELSERTQALGQFGSVFDGIRTEVLQSNTGSAAKIIEKIVPSFHVEPSFEQLQAEAIKAQEEEHGEKAR